MSFSELPAISVNPLQQFPQYGASSVTISCTVTASPSADTVGWRKITVDSSSTTNIDAPNSNGKYSVANSVTNPDLTINNVVFTDDANYQCYATNAVGTGNSALARVDVQGSKYIIYRALHVFKLKLYYQRTSSAFKINSCRVK